MPWQEWRSVIVDMLSIPSFIVLPFRFRSGRAIAKLIGFYTRTRAPTQWGSGRIPRD